MLVCAIHETFEGWEIYVEAIRCYEETHGVSVAA
jgi:hypothetical protein